MRIASSLAVVVAILAVGSVSPASGQAPRVRDSAGVRIVENGSRAKAPIAFVMSATPQFDLGGLKDRPDDEFETHTGYWTPAIRLSSGGHAVADGVKVRFFDANGKQVKVAGRAGEGPNEFRRIGSICRTRGDTLVVHDVANARIMILDGNGNYVRQFVIGTADYTAESCFDDGTFVIGEYHRAAAGAPQNPTHVVRRRIDGTVVGSIGDFWSGPTTYNNYTSPEPSLSVTGDRFYVGDPRSSEVRGYDTQGKLVIIVRTDDPVAKVTPAEADAMTPLSYAMSNGVRIPAPERPKPTEWPSYGRIKTDPSGRLWVPDYPKDHRRDALNWTVFDREGRMLGRFPFPAAATEFNTKVVAFTPDGVQVRRLDSDGAAHYMTYRLTKP